MSLDTKALVIATLAAVGTGYIAHQLNLDTPQVADGAARLVEMLPFGKVSELGAYLTNQAMYASPLLLGAGAGVFAYNKAKP